MRKVRNAGNPPGCRGCDREPCLLPADDAEESLNDHDDGSIKENFREQDIYLPIANVARIMKNAVPQTGKVSFRLRRGKRRLGDS